MPKILSPNELMTSQAEENRYKNGFLYPIRRRVMLNLRNFDFKKCVKN